MHLCGPLTPPSPGARKETAIFVIQRVFTFEACVTCEQGSAFSAPPPLFFSSGFQGPGPLARRLDRASGPGPEPRGPGPGAPGPGPEARAGGPGFGGQGPEAGDGPRPPGPGPKAPRRPSGLEAPGGDGGP